MGTAPQELTPYVAPYLRARYMNTDTGRFHTMDSFEGFRTTPLSLHKYLYANGNPVIGADPSGRVTLVSLMMGSSISATLDRTSKSIKVQAGRRIARRAGCFVISSVIDAAITEGVYILFSGGVPVYVGQSKNVQARLAQHMKKWGTKIDLHARVFNLKGSAAKKVKEEFEQLVINALGEKRALGSNAKGLLGNKVNPIGRGRRAGSIIKLCK